MPVAYKTNAPTLTVHQRQCLEEGRVDSFDERWPHPSDSGCSGPNMAKAGFYYTGDHDCVKCFVCHVKLSGWIPDDDHPWQKHLEFSPNCLFAKLAKEENDLTVEQWMDVLCSRAVNRLDQVLYKTQEKVESKAGEPCTN